jgi:hypothetical protein
MPVELVDNMQYLQATMLPSAGTEPEKYKSIAVKKKR